MNASLKAFRFGGLVMVLSALQSAGIADVTVVMTPKYVNIPVEGGFTATFILTQFGGSLIGAFDSVIRYDPAVVQITSISAPTGSGWHGNLRADAASFRSGRTRVVGFKASQDSGATTSEPIVNVSWRAMSPNRGSSEIALELLSVIDANWRPIGVTTWASTAAVSDADSDGDGLPDTWELLYFGNATTTPNGDHDGDGFSNLEEYRAGSNPRDALESPLKVMARLLNFSVRSVAGAGDQSLIVGFATSGAQAKQILLRGIGPSLAQFGLSGALADPVLSVFTGTTLVAQNEGWGGGATLANAFAQVGAFPLVSSSRDSALLLSLPANAYSAQITGNADTGIALVEAYDADVGSPVARIINLSARNHVGTGAGVLIAGFVVAGNAPRTLVMRAVGPTLAQFGVIGTLADPKLDIYFGAELIHSNDNWGGRPSLSNAFIQVGAFPLPNGSQDAAAIITLQPGSYTAQVSGVGGTSGVALVELYELPQLFF